MENITENALDEINKNIFFHTSSSDNIGGISKNGLQPNQPNGLTEIISSLKQTVEKSSGIYLGSKLSDAAKYWSIVKSLKSKQPYVFTVYLKHNSLTLKRDNYDKGSLSGSFTI